jgi:hypothetical protein
MNSLPISDCRLPISREAGGQEIGNWQLEIGNTTRRLVNDNVNG